MILYDSGEDPLCFGHESSYSSEWLGEQLGHTSLAIGVMEPDNPPYIAANPDLFGAGADGTVNPRDLTTRGPNAEDLDVDAILRGLDPFGSPASLGTHHQPGPHPWVGEFGLTDPLGGQTSSISSFHDAHVSAVAMPRHGQ